MIMWLASKPLAICSANQKAKGRLMGQGCCWCSPAPASSPAPKRPPHPGKQAGGQATSAQQSVLFIYHLSTGLLSPGWSSVSHSCRAPHCLKDHTGLLWGPTTLGRIAQHLEASDRNEPDPVTEMKYFVWQNELNNWLIDGLIMLTLH